MEGNEMHTWAVNAKVAAGRLSVCEIARRTGLSKKTIEQ
jgi:hypothetical protein